MRFSVIAIAASLVAAAVAQTTAPTVFITAPILSTTWAVNVDNTMTWKDVKAGAPTTDVDVTLFTGDPAKQVQVAKLGTAKYADLKFTFKIPLKTKSDWYSIQIGDVWSAQFKVKGDGELPVGTPPSRNATSTTVTSTITTASTATSTSTISKNSTTSSTATATPTGNSGNYLSAGSLTAAAAAAVAAVLAL
ncbi:hypothetical protein BGW38_003482 [Lunasporangiospora selenospora]|uniref:Ser-Thr-rich glycosyl-phosphatidyl-inositol-anchored membrane family-domain-containing protein n=1 Tax=Lunasporangiospora selenospora TaxID=979761 RepID=A0A9P6KCN8_9FUNG|nr:hypothetical protein BGW38_003482 [Lunasporangiospora selenospora]